MENGRYKIDQYEGGCGSDVLILAGTSSVCTTCYITNSIELIYRYILKLFIIYVCIILAQIDKKHILRRRQIGLGIARLKADSEHHHEFGEECFSPGNFWHDKFDC